MLFLFLHHAVVVLSCFSVFSCFSLFASCLVFVYQATKPKTAMLWKESVTNAKYCMKEKE